MATAMNIDISRRVAAHIRLLRKKRGWTVSDLHARLIESGCEFITENKIYLMEERASSRVTIDHAVWIARAFGIALQTLVEPQDCDRCSGKPPAGFMCTDCGATG